MPNTESKIQRAIRSYGMSRADATRHVAEIEARDEATRQIKAQIPTYYSKTLGRNVTVPQD